MKRLWMKLLGVRPLELRSYDPMPEEAMLTAFASAPQKPLYRAVQQLLDEEFAAATQDALGPEIPESVKNYHLGGVDRIARVKVRIEKIVEHAQRAQRGEAEEAR